MNIGPKFIQNNTNKHSDVSSIYIDRLLNTISTVIFGYIFYILYRDYISIEWGYTGLIFTSLGWMEILFIFIGIAIQGWSMPQTINSPSSVILWMATTLIYVPTMIITLMIGERSSDQYYVSLLALTMSMIFVSYISSKSHIFNDCPLPPFKFYAAFTGIFLLFTIILILQYSSIMSFSNIDDVYFQRFNVSDMDTFFVVSYIRTHYLYVFSSFLFAAGIVNRRFWYLMILGLSGYLVTYLIDASKIAFIIPVLMVAFLAVHRSLKGKAWALSAGLAATSFLFGTLINISGYTKLIADLLLVRAIAIPAQTFAQYSDVFADRGYTYWSHVKGIGLVVSRPDSFAADPQWPVLGQIVGSAFFGMDSRVNLNANLFVGEGIAAAGALGIIAIGLAFAIFLRAIDNASKGWNREIIILISVPLGMALANVHLSTLLLSFGGIFWLMVLSLFRPRAGSGSVL